MRRARLALAVGAAVLAGAVPAAAADPPSATITLHGDGAAQVVVVRTLGPAPARGATLVDAGGATTVGVQVLDPGDDRCRSTDARSTGLGDAAWCLSLSSLSAGHEVKGSLTGAQSVLALDVSSRASIAWPLVVTLLGLVVAAGLAFVATQVLPGLVTGWRERRLRAGQGPVAGLADWARDAAPYLSRADVVSRASWAARYGPALVAAGRRDLGAAVRATTLPPCPLLAAAQDEIAHTGVAVADLLTAQGARTTSRAASLLATLRHAEEARDRFVELADYLISKQENPDARKASEALKQQGLARLGALSQTTLDWISDGFDTNLESIERQTYAHGPADQRAFLAGLGGLPGVAVTGRRHQAGETVVAVAQRSAGVLSVLAVASVLDAGRGGDGPRGAVPAERELRRDGRLRHAVPGRGRLVERRRHPRGSAAAARAGRVARLSQAWEHVFA